MQEAVEVQQVSVKVYRTAERLTVATPMPGLQPEDEWNTRAARP